MDARRMSENSLLEELLATRKELGAANEELSSMRERAVQAAPRSATALLALSYAQQEDEVLEDVYMKRWQASFEAAHSAICNPRHHRPLVMNGGLPLTSYNTNSMAWGPPVAP